MAHEQEKVTQNKVAEQSESEEKGGASMSPPAFSLSAGAAGAPIQRQEGPTAETSTQTITLTAAQITAARSQNAFLLGQATAINALQTALGVPASGTFDNATLNAIANYQAAQAMTRRDGRMDQATLSALIQVLVTASNFVGAAAIARDFFKLDQQATPLTVNYNAALSEISSLNGAILELGPTAFANGLTSLGAAVDSALGAGASIANQSFGVLEAGTNAQRQTAMWNNPNATNETGLAVWVREQFPTEASIREYLNRQDVTEAEKVATLGQLAVELGRLEFLMGVLYHGGTDKSWETGGNNQGPFVNNFKSEVGNTANTAPWCTMFSGYLRRLLGFNAALSTRGPLIFNAGARLDSWATEGQNLLTARDDFSDPSDFENYSGGSIDSEDWVALRRTLRRAGITEAERQQAVTDFFSTRITPQPGDIMVVNGGSTTNAYGEHSSSHTVNVESYSNYTVSTIEGNKGHKVTGTTIDFTDPTAVSHVIILARLGMEFFPHDEPQAQEPAAPEGQQPVAEGGAEAPAAAPAPEAITAAQILSPLQVMTRELQLLADRREYISSDAAGATVSTMAGANSAGGDR